MGYYKPTIEEFFVGFEYECKPIGMTQVEYMKMTYSGSTALLSEFKYSELRVKTLDEYDLVDLGWKTAYSPSYVMDDQSILLHSIGEEPKWFNLEKDGELIVITECKIYNEVSGNWNQEPVFKGRIKNKSELRKLMQQLEIQ